MVFQHNTDISSQSEFSSALSCGCTPMKELLKVSICIKSMSRATNVCTTVYWPNTLFFMLLIF